MKCRLCSGMGLVMVQRRDGYHVYQRCPACLGTTEIPPRLEAERHTQ
jgi:excinuclease UvrABC ATPase subunit